MTQPTVIRTIKDAGINQGDLHLTINGDSHISIKRELLGEFSRLVEKASLIEAENQRDAERAKAKAEGANDVILNLVPPGEFLFICRSDDGDVHLKYRGKVNNPKNGRRAVHTTVDHLLDTCNNK